MTTEIRCTDGCGRKASSADSAASMGWTCLQITGRYRCPTCAAELSRANSLSDDQARGMDSTMGSIEP